MPMMIDRQCGAIRFPCLDDDGELRVKCCHSAAPAAGMGVFPDGFDGGSRPTGGGLKSPTNLLTALSAVNRHTAYMGFFC